MQRYLTASCQQAHQAQQRGLLQALEEHFLAGAGLPSARVGSDSAGAAATHAAALAARGAIPALPLHAMTARHPDWAAGSGVAAPSQRPSTGEAFPVSTRPRSIAQRASMSVWGPYVATHRFAGPYATRLPEKRILDT
jgi:hypothetical protein